MARKHSATNTSGVFDSSGVAPARERNARPRRAKVEIQAEPALAAVTPAPTSSSEDSSGEHEIIARLAYSYWESRGCQGGSPEEDWLRAEAEYRASRSEVLV